MRILIANETIALKEEGIGGWITINFASVSTTYNNNEENTRHKRESPNQLAFQTVQMS